MDRFSVENGVREFVGFSTTNMKAAWPNSWGETHSVSCCRIDLYMFKKKDKNTSE